MEFAVLGSVAAWHDGRELPLGGAKQRALLAILLLNANEVVSRDRLIDGLWGERPPRTAGHTLDNYISRLRKVLGDARVSRRAPGYVLHVEGDELDLDRFERLSLKGRESLARGDAREAAITLRSALALWRGAALADVLYEPFAARESERLEERRLTALEDRIDADLALGGGGEIVSELESLVREHPLRERLLGQLMLGLYRSGRQAEALAAVQAARHRLAEELGLEPGPQLRELEQRILLQDPELAARRPWLARAARPSLSPVAVAVAAAALAVSITAGIVARLGETTASEVGLGTTNEILDVNTISGRTVQAVSLDGAPSAIAASGGSLWITNPDSASVSRINVSSVAVVDRIPVSGQPAEIAVAGRSVWVANTVNGEVTRIDPRTGTITQRIPLGGNPVAIASGPHELWVAEAGDKALIRIDAVSGTPIQTVSLADRPSAVAVGYGAVWVASHDAGTVTEIDSRSGRQIATFHVGHGPAALVLGAGSAWVANNLDGTVWRLDPGTSRVVATIAVGSAPIRLAFASGSLWVANKFSKTVSQIDPHRDAVVRTITTGGRPTGLAVTAGHLWIGTRPSGDAHRGGTLTLLGFRPSSWSIDPAFNQTWYPPPQFTGLAYDTLVTFERTGGPQGLNLVPDLALAVPEPTDSGTSYAFRLRPGIRYSDGRRLRASDIRRGLERLFRLGSPGAELYKTIRGAPACARDPMTCDLSRGVVVDDAAQTITFRLAEPDPQLLYKLTFGWAVPAPPGTPSHDMSLRPIPGTGPYRLVRATDSETRFTRNPYFREWSHAAQPDGYPNEIVWRLGLPPANQVRLIEHSRADWMFEPIPPRLRSEIQLHHAAQLRINPVFGTEFLTIDTRVPPFDDPRVRSALNDAIDRNLVTQMFGGPSLARPTCQILPPGLLGYRRYCPYTVGGSAGVPNRARAKRLVAASRTAGARIDVGVVGDDCCIPSSVFRYVTRVLRDLGYRVRIHKADNVPFAPITWFGGELGAAEFLQTWFACDGAHTEGRYCDRRLDRLMVRALSLEGTDLRSAALAWAEVDRRVADTGAAIPLVTPREVEFVSSRLRNYQFHPIWGFLPDQAWVQ